MYKKVPTVMYCELSNTFKKSDVVSSCILIALFLIVRVFFTATTMKHIKIRVLDVGCEFLCVWGVGGGGGERGHH